MHLYFIILLDTHHVQSLETKDCAMPSLKLCDELRKFPKTVWGTCSKHVYTWLSPLRNSVAAFYLSAYIMSSPWVFYCSPPPLHSPKECRMWYTSEQYHDPIKMQQMLWTYTPPLEPIWEFATSLKQLKGGKTLTSTIFSALNSTT